MYLRWVVLSALQLIVLAILGEPLPNHCPSHQYLERDRPGTVQCHFDQGRGVAWYAKTDSAEYMQIVEILDGVKSGGGYEDGIFDIHPDGSLIIKNVSVNHDGYFRVFYPSDNPSSNVTEDVEVVVTVTPSPAFLLVDGCDPTSYCSLTRDRVGNITCSVRGVRPALELEWRTLHETDGKDVTFTEKQRFISNDDGTCDVEVMAQFQIHSNRVTKITVQCRAVGTLADRFHLSTTLDLVFPQEQPQWQYYLMSLLIIPLAAFFGVILFKKGTLHERLESLKMLFKRREEQQNSHDVEIPLVGRPAISDEDMLTYICDQLKLTYRRWFAKPQRNASETTSNASDTQQVFVCSCLEVSSSARPGNNWRELKSYQELLTDSSNRIIIEGDPGYGKSTMIQQVAIDWCEKNPLSAFGKLKLFILLRMGLVGRTTSFYEAVLETLLPKETYLTAQDIQRVISNCDSIVIALDDFHEHPEQEIRDDFENIINGEMLQDATVLSVTRPSCVPKDFKPGATIIRLTGFNSDVQDLYISNVLEDYPWHSKMELTRDYKSSEIFAKLSQVPLFLTTGLSSYLQLMIYDAESSLGKCRIHSVTGIFEAFMGNLKRTLVGGSHLDKQDQLKLGKVVLERMTHGNELIWFREEMISLIGTEGYKEFVEIGVLVEYREEEHSCLPTSTDRVVRVRFYDTIFSEWFASLYLVRLLGKPSVFGKNEDRLKKLNPLDFRYLYRFTCGLGEEAASTILKYVKSVHNSEAFAILCSIEKPENTDNELGTIMLLGGTVELKPGNELQQYSTMLLLGMAAKSKITINKVTVDRCYALVGSHGQRLGINLDLTIPPINSLTELVICDPGRDMSVAETRNILSYMSLCENLERLRLMNTFHPFISFMSEDESLLMSLSMNEQVLLRGNIDEYVLQKIKESKCTVEWSPLDDSCTYILDLVSGKWKIPPQNGICEPVHDDRSSLREEECGALEDLTIEEHDRMGTKYEDFWRSREEQD